MGAHPKFHLTLSARKDQLKNAEEEIRAFGQLTLNSNPFAKVYASLSSGLFLRMRRMYWPQFEPMRFSLVSLTDIMMS